MRNPLKRGSHVTGHYDVSPDAQRLLMLKQAAGPDRRHNAHITQKPSGGTPLTKFVDNRSSQRESEHQDPV
jgi:hypothetical protein